MSEEHLPKELKKQIGQLLEQARDDFRTMEGTKKERLLKLAKDIESLGYPKDLICETISKALANEIKDSYIRQVLPKEFKRKYEKPEENEIADRSDIDVEKPIEESNTPTPIPISTDGKPIINDDSDKYGKTYKKMLEWNKLDLDHENTMNDITKIKEYVAGLEDQLQTSKLEKGQLQEQIIEQKKQTQELIKSLNAAAALKKQDKTTTTKPEDSLEYKTIQSELEIIKQERDELKQVISRQMKENPSQTFQNASDIPGITTVTTTIPNEVEMPGRDLSTMFLDSRSGCNVMYLQINGNKVVTWETDVARKKREAKTKVGS